MYVQVSRHVGGGSLCQEFVKQRARKENQGFPTPLRLIFTPWVRISEVYIENSIYTCKSLQCSIVYYTIASGNVQPFFYVKFVIWYNTLIENTYIVYENFQYKVNLYVYTKNILCVYLDILYGLLITDRCVQLLSCNNIVNYFALCVRVWVMCSDVTVASPWRGSEVTTTQQHSCIVLALYCFTCWQQQCFEAGHM